MRDLDHKHIGLSGLRVAEAHQDGCPHWHIWMLYQSSNEREVLATVMKYFAGKLKVRSGTGAPDRYFDEPEDLHGPGRLADKPKEGAQTEWARIDRSISNGATYIMKYLLKTVDAGEQMNKEVGLFDDEPPKEAEKARHDHAASCARVDAYRSVWGLNAWQLFGVRKCMTIWDGLRRHPTAPLHPFLYELWVCARGTDRPGRLSADCGVQGDAKGFIQKLGGLQACRARLTGMARRAPRVDVARLTVEKRNYYGDATAKMLGVMLVRREYRSETVGTRVTRRGIRVPRNGWRLHKIPVERLVTRTDVWKLEPMTDEQALAAGLDVEQKPVWEPPRAIDPRELERGLPILAPYQRPLRLSEP